MKSLPLLALVTDLTRFQKRCPAETQVSDIYDVVVRMAPLESTALLLAVAERVVWMVSLKMVVMVGFQTTALIVDEENM